jgi:hypothetical protein
MSLSDCPKCWDTPCTCGYEYRDWSTERMIKFISDIIKDRDDVITIKYEIGEM